MEKQKQYPVEIKEVDAETTKEINKHWKLKGYSNNSKWIWIGPNRYFMPEDFKEDASRIFNMEVRPSDVWVVTLPRSGTTLMQELIWQFCHDLDFRKTDANTEPLDQRFPFLEFRSLLGAEFLENMGKDYPMFADQYQAIGTSEVDILNNMTCRRFIKTHLPISILPPGLLDTAKVVYITRDPRDVAVSYYHLHRMFVNRVFVEDFPSYWKLFVNGHVTYHPFFPHVKEAWERKNHPNMLFLFYEDIIKDIPKTIRHVASFLDKDITEEQVSMLAEHLSIEKFRQNKTLNYENAKDMGLLVPDEQAFIRKGKSGGWRDYFDADMSRQAEQWIADNLKDTDLRFPN